MNRSPERIHRYWLLRFLDRWGNPRGIIRLTWLLLLAGLAWRFLRYALRFPLFGDEAFLAINLLTRDFNGLIGSLEYNQIVSAGFMWLELAVVKLLGGSEYALRLLPFLSGLAALIFFWKWVSEILPKREVLLAVGIFAGGYYLVRHGTELKPYALDVLLAVLFNWLVWKIVQQKPRLIFCLVVLILSLLGPWISYPFIFIAGGQILFLGMLAIKKRSGFQLTFSAFLGVLLFFSFLSLYLFHIFPQSQSAHDYFTDWMEWNMAFPPISEPWMIPWWLLKVHTGLMMAYPIGSDRGGSIITFLLVLLGLTTLWRRGDRKLLGFLLAPLVVAFLAACLQKYPYGTTARTMLYMAPAFCLLMGVGLMKALKICLPKRRVSAGMVSAACFFFIILFAGAVRDILRPYKELQDYHLRQAFQGMLLRSSPFDQWIVFSDYGPRSPDGLRVGGGGAVFRYYLMTMVPSVKGVWSAAKWPPEKSFPFPDQVEANRKTHLLAYRGDRGTFNELQWIAYLRSLERRLGPGQRQIFFLKRTKKAEGQELAVEAYTFSPGTRCWGQGLQ